MKARTLLRLYPTAWRIRYAAEMADLLGDRQLTLGLALDLLRGALDAHLHPELAGMALAPAGGGVLPLLPRSPAARALAATVLMLAVALGWGLAQPNPVLPLFLPIGAHASAEALAQAKEPALPIRASVQRDGVAAVLLAQGTRTALVFSSRAPTRGWMDRGGGMGIGSEPSAEHPLSVMVTSSGSDDLSFLAVSGTSTSDVARVELLFRDGSRETLTPHDGAFLWLETTPAITTWTQSAGRWVRPYGPNTPMWQEPFVFLRVPSEVVAWSGSGVELARIALLPK